MAIYYPLLKTTMSEMRALKKMDLEGLENIQPVLELTRSRKSKKFPEGSMEKKIDEISETLKSQVFCLDITSDETLSSPHIESLFDESDGFSNWVDFIRYLVEEKALKVIPVVQLFQDTPIDELRDQIENLAGAAGSVACRISADFESLDVTNELIQLVADVYNSVFIVDAEYIDYENPDSIEEKIGQVVGLINDIPGSVADDRIVLVSSSFPKSIVTKAGDVRSGSISIDENKFMLAVSDASQRNIQYGDYGLIHPYRNEPGIYTFIPRIDFPTEDEVYYMRFKREHGGYKSCADSLVQMDVFLEDDLDCWGVEEIQVAADSKPNGKSASYWISVRSNIHMTRVSKSMLES